MECDGGYGRGISRVVFKEYIGLLMLKKEDSVLKDRDRIWAMGEPAKGGHKVIIEVMLEEGATEYNLEMREADE